MVQAKKKLTHNRTGICCHLHGKKYVVIFWIWILHCVPVYKPAHTNGDLPPFQSTPEHTLFHLMQETRLGRITNTKTSLHVRFVGEYLDSLSDAADSRSIVLTVITCYSTKYMNDQGRFQGVGGTQQTTLQWPQGDRLVSQSFQFYLVLIS